MSRRQAAIPPGQQGVALVTALLIVALAAVLAFSLISSQQIALRRTTNILHTDQALLLALGVEAWAGRLLLQDARQGETDQPAEAWTRGLATTATAGGQVSARIEDLAARFNLNNLLAPTPTFRTFSRQQFTRLLTQCGGDPETAGAVIDWLDQDRQGAWEEDAYLEAGLSWRPANQPMRSVSELRLVLGIDQETYQCLAPLVAALPDPTPVNVNTASPEVLASLSSSLDLEQARTLAARRPETGYATVNDFLAAASLAGGGLSQAFLSVSSSFFMVHSNASVGDGRIFLNSILHRTPDGIEIVSRTLGPG